MSDIPEEILDLAARRHAAREARDFATADALRVRIRMAGFDVVDTTSGSELVARQEGAPEAEGPTVHGKSEAVPSVLEEPPVFDASIQWIVQGWPEDVVRGVESFRRYSGDRSTQHVVVDLTDTGIDRWPEGTDLVRLDPEEGWASGRNAGLRRAAGRVVVLVDGSVEAEAATLDPLVGALDDATVGITGPFGIVTDDLREFRESKGPEVDAVEGYLMAFRRELVEGGLRFDERFKFYRTADIELSFQVKAMGLRATVTSVPLRRHQHRMWANTPEDERARLSKRNFYRFLDKWRGRTDLLVSHPTRRDGRGSPGSGRPILPKA
ncbi:MAG: glycosyltransferase family 2 protein [Actinomycetota bacterium]